MASSPALFTTQRGYAQLHVELQAPALELFDTGRLTAMRHLLEHLAVHSLQADNIKWESGDGALSRVHLLCSFPGLAVTLRLGIERVELESFAVESAEPSALARLAHDVLAAVQSLYSENRFKTFILDIGLHGLVAGRETKDFLAAFSVEAPALGGALLGTGCSFYYGPEGPQLTASLTLDQSAVVSNALFFRVRTTWDGSKLQPHELEHTFADHLGVALGSIGLTLEV